MANTAPPLPPGGRVELPGRGRPWVWDSGGEGPTVVLLHGWTSTAALNWYEVMPALSEGFRVLAMDHRGHGRGIRTRRFRLEDCADDVAALAATLGTGPVIAVGYSMGGPVAQLLWRRHRASVAGVVLCATAASFPGRGELAPLIDLAATGLSVACSAVPVDLRRWAIGQLVRSRSPGIEAWALEEKARSDLASLIQAGAALSTYDSAPWIGELDVPSAVIVTTEDRTVPVDAQRRLASAIPGAEVHEVAWGHRACVEAPEAFVPALISACHSLTARASCTPFPVGPDDQVGRRR